MKRHRQIYVWLLCALMVLTAVGCRKLVGPTRVRVIDNGRHYVPILQGDVLRMFWTIHNDGPEPLVIEEIQPSCSAIKLISALPDVVINGDSVVLIFDFDTDKNTNLATHTIRIFGNIIPAGETEMRFDVNIVRPTVDMADYEERYFSRGKPDAVSDGRNIRICDYYIVPANVDNLLGL